MLQNLKHKIINISKRIFVPGFAGMSFYDLLSLYWEGIFNGFISLRAGAVAYSFFMALFPFILFTISLIPYIPIEGFQNDFITFFHDILPAKSINLMDDIIQDIATKPKAGLMSLGILLSFFFMANGVNSLLTSFEESAHKIIDKRTIFKQYLVAMGLSFILVIILFITLAAIIFFEIIIVYQLQKRGIIHDYNFWVFWGKKLFYFIMIIISISLIYYFGTKEGKKLKFISPGSLMSTFLIIVNIYLFQFYIENFNRYDKLYGSIGAFLVILLLNYLNAIILLLGHELNIAILRFKTYK